MATNKELLSNFFGRATGIEDFFAGVETAVSGAQERAQLAGQPRHGEQRTVVIPGTNNVVLQQWNKDEQAWETVGSGSVPQGSAGGGLPPTFRPGELDLLNRQLAEDERHNRVTEANIQRQRALDAASQAMSAFLRATEAADARRLSAFDVSTALLPSLVDPGQEFFSGQEPGGALAAASSRFGLPFSPTRIQHKQFTPASLALPPELDPGVMTGIAGIPRG